MQVLVVEPDNDLLYILEFLLRRAGYAVLTARDGPTAQRLWQQQAPALVLTETDLPGLSGWALCRTVRAAGTTPLVFLSSATSDADVAHGLALGANAYLTKPFSPRELRACLAAILRRTPTPAAG
jgi:DNA-binding response OmpR family regulator